MKTGRERAAWRKLLHYVWLIVIPFLVQALLLVSMRPLRHLGPDVGSIGVLTPLVSAAVGFIFVTRGMTGAQKILVGLPYFPVMCGLLFLFSLGLIGRFFGDWL